MNIKIEKKHIPLLILVAAVLLFALMFVFKPGSKSQAVGDKARPVHVEVIKVGSQIGQLVLYGRVVSPRMSRLTSAVTAYVAETPVLAGTQVSKGQLLIKLDDRDAKNFFRQKQAEVDQLKAELKREGNRDVFDKKAMADEKKIIELRKKSLGRIEELAGKGYASQQDVDRSIQDLKQSRLVLHIRELAIENHAHRLQEARAKLAKAEALRDQANLDLERTQVKSPFDGRLTELHVAVGDRVQPDDKLAVVYDTSAIEVEAQVPNRYAELLRNSFKSEQKITAYAMVDGHRVDMHLQRMGRFVATGHAGVDAWLLVTSGVDHLSLGLSMEVVMQLPQIDKVVSLPVDALYGKQRLYKVVDGKMQAVQVEHIADQVFAKGGRRIIVRSPLLKDGDVVVVSQIPDAITGLFVKPIIEERHGEKQPN